MARYYVDMNPQPNVDHEVHRDRCCWLTFVKDSRYLGYYSSCQPAVDLAKLSYPTANGCWRCSRDCHTG